MKKTLYILSMLAIAACTADNIAIKEPIKSDVKFYASFEGEDLTKTYLDNEGNIRWNADDRVSIFAGKTYNQQFSFDGKTGERVNTFSPVGILGDGNDLQANYAIYPYSAGNTISEEGVLGVSLPEIQPYVADAFGGDVNTMVAATENTDNKHLLFKNACGYLKMSLYGEETIIKTLTLRGNNGEKISGTAHIDALYGAAPVVTPGDDATNSITIDCGEGVALGTSQETATVFYFVVPPVVFTNGITITATATDGRVFEKSTTRPLTVERNKIAKMSAPLEYDIPAPFAGLTFRAEESTSEIVLNKIDENAAEITLEYRTGKHWLPYTIGTDIELEPGDTVGFRAGEAGNESLNGYQFSMTGKICASGNIMSLLDKSLTRNSVSENCFNALFAYCTVLYTAPELPATNLAAYCYANMFKDCWNLTSTPELPATTLADHCYYQMFYYCCAIELAPALPATTLVSHCYDSMFDLCTHLVEAPELPATTLASNCYRYMFHSCYALVNAPELPATTLANYCYFGMFRECRNISSAPVLSARFLAEGCYQYMFYRCSSLNYVKMLATDISPEDSFDYWLYDVAQKGELEINYDLFESFRQDPTRMREALNVPENWSVSFKN